MVTSKRVRCVEVEGQEAMWSCRRVKVVEGDWDPKKVIDNGRTDGNTVEASGTSASSQRAC